MRGFVCGVMNCIGNFSASLIPYMGVLTDYLGVHFLSGFLPLSFMTFVFSFFLPETMNIKVEN